MSNIAILENAHNIGGKKFATIPLSEIEIDTSYQRKLRNKVHKMAREWDYALCDVILVSYRDDKFYVIDGQHRVEAARKRGVKFLPCQIVEFLTREEEARRFLALNTNTTKLSSYDTLNANLLRKDPVDTIVKSVCDKWGIIIDGSYTNRIGRLGSLYDTRNVARIYGEKTLDWVFSILHDAHWNESWGGHSGAIILALAKAYEEFKNQLPAAYCVLAATMKNKNPQVFKADARSTYPEFSDKAAIRKYVLDIVYESFGSAMHIGD